MVHKCACGGPCSRCLGKCKCTTCALPNGKLSAARISPEGENTAHAAALDALRESVRIEKLMAVEYGFRASEKGWNLERTLAEYRKLTDGTN